MSDYGKPLPDVTEEHARPYWEAAKRHELRMQRCPLCGHVRFPPAKFCPECLDENDDWVLLSGLGTVWSFGIYHHVFDPSFKDDVPYNVVLVALAEGPRLIGNLVCVANDQITVGLPVEVHFDDVTEDVTLVNFRPRPAG